MKNSKKYLKLDELTENQYSKLLEDLDNFNNKFISEIAGTDKYEIIPTVMEDGSRLTKEQYALARTECSRLGLKVIYQISLRNGDTIFINPENLKVGYIREGAH